MSLAQMHSCADLQNDGVAHDTTPLEGSKHAGNRIEKFRNLFVDSHRSNRVQLREDNQSQGGLNPWQVLITLVVRNVNPQVRVAREEDGKLVFMFDEIGGYTKEYDRLNEVERCSLANKDIMFENCLRQMCIMRPNN